MEFLNALFFTFVLVGPIFFGAYLVLFSRQYTIRTLQFRKSVWRIGYGDADIRAVRVLAVLVGIALMIVGVIRTVQWVLR